MKKSSEKIEEIDTRMEFLCPSCRALISVSDKYCRKCGVNLAGSSTPPSEELPQELYERKLSLPQRLYKLLVAPSEAMNDIALAPEYGGALVVVSMKVVLVIVAGWMIMQKIQISGPYASEIFGMISDILVLAVLIGVVLLVVRWLLKSLIVKLGCDSESGWAFETAASITGYAYISDVIMGILGICIGWFLLPTFHLDSVDLEAMRRAVDVYQAQVWRNLVYTLPFSVLGLLWKSYLGGLGARFGTKEKCSLSRGLAVFFVLSLVGLLFSFVT